MEGTLEFRRGISVGRLKKFSVCVVLSAAPLFSQPAPGAPNSPFPLLRDALHTFYPELFGKARFLALTTYSELDREPIRIDEINFKVTPNPPGSENPTFSSATGKPVEVNNPVFEGYIQFDPTGRIERLEVWNSPILMSAQNDSFRSLVQTHPRWSRDEAYAALEDAGAQFGPEKKAALLQSIHLTKFTKFLGPSKIDSIRFDDFLNPDHVGNFASFTWVVYLDTELPIGSERRYALTFEPFGGRLTGITRVP